MSTFTKGQRVRLIPDGEFPEEFGVYECPSGKDTAIIIVEDKFLLGIDDDGMREVEVRFLEPA